MKNSGITAHMIVKNEDQWVWYAIQSVLPYVDQFLITDTGSTDHTVDVIKSIKSAKIVFTQVNINSRLGVTQARSDQLSQTKTDWIWIVDGDEIYKAETAKECVVATNVEKYEGILVRRYDLLGDIYHRQKESVGSYNLFGHQGHLVTRLLNQSRIKGLHYEGEYPIEGWYDRSGISTQQHNPKLWYITRSHLYHAMYLRRSSNGSNLNMFNRGKYRIETGIKIEDNIPEIFSRPHPSIVPDPLNRRNWSYKLAAQIITPIKSIKRRFL